MTRVLAIGSDRSIFDAESASRARQEAYASEFGNLDVIVFSRSSDKVQPFERGALRGYPTNVRFRILNVWCAVRIARSLARPDVVTAQDPFEAGLTAWLVSALHGVPLHIQVHTDFLSPEFARLSLLNMARVFVAGFVLRRASRVRVVSERVRTSIQKRYRLRLPLAILPVFVDRERIVRAPTSDELRKRLERFKTKVLVVSRLEKEKDVSLAISSFAQSAPDDAGLIVVGEGRERASLGRLVETLGLRGKVLFEGRQDPAPYYKVSDLVLFSSKYDGYGMVIVEALAAGKPVLSADVGIAQEVGAITVSRENFADALRDWFEKGPRTGELKGYPYSDFAAYVRAYGDDITSCVSGQKTQ